MKATESVDAYIAAQPVGVRARLTAIRQAFHDVVPDTMESIRYNMPAFSVGKDQLYIGAYAHHIGMYPMYDLLELEDQLRPFRGKGTTDALHFKHTQPLPLPLIKTIIRRKNDLTHE